MPGTIFLAIGAIFAFAGWAIANSLDVQQLAFLFGALGAGIVLVVLAFYWRTALERAGFYGTGPERRNLYSIAPRVEKRLSQAIVVTVVLTWPVARGVTGTPFGGLACLLTFIGGLSLMAGLAELAIHGLTEAKWRWRERG